MQRTNRSRGAVMYLRAASGNRTDHKHALSVQRDACERESKRLGAVLTDEFVDLGVRPTSSERGAL
jgi:hypothetical protein